MELVQSLLNVIMAMTSFVIVLSKTLFPWLPLGLWIAFWLFAVNWRQLYPVLSRGAGVGACLLSLLIVFVWCTLAEPANGTHNLAGLQVSNPVGKFVYVSNLIIIAMFCGSVQLAGTCGRWCNFDAQSPADKHKEHEAKHPHA
ncbi:hypothetical protein [Planctomicrobium sp. SH527]|uniref:hypothetical protein n=1 Tax=Planctomicrobium sp. SH527 TaxID=3448123 RepID=UPI003F5CB145